MASDDKTMRSMPVEHDNVEPKDGSSPLFDDDELTVNFHVVKPQHPEEDDRFYVFRVARRLLASEESSKSVVPHLLSHTNIPRMYHHCPQFIQVVSRHLSSLPIDTDIVLFYDVVLDVAETLEFHWIYSFMREEVEADDDEEEGTSNNSCAICLQELQAWGSTEAKAVMPCSHVFHPSCLLRWLLQNDNCPLCRCPLDVASGSFH